MAFGPIALAIAALFTGAAFYVTFAEHPARLMLDTRHALVQWKPSYKRGFIMQASLAVLGFVFGALAWTQDGNRLWLAGALVLLANWPFTMLAILPTNRVLMDTAPDDAGPETQVLLAKWGLLHGVRTLLGALSTAIFLWLLI